MMKMRLWAIRRNGEICVPYDDDVEGPCFVGGTRLEAYKAFKEGGRGATEGEICELTQDDVVQILKLGITKQVSLYHGGEFKTMELITFIKEVF